MSNVLDLRLNEVAEIRLTRGIIYSDLFLDFIDITPPADIRITLNNWDENPTTVFTVGSGLTITGFKVFWNLGEVNPVGNKVTGVIDTVSKVFGNAVNIALNLTIS